MLKCFWLIIALTAMFSCESTDTGVITAKEKAEYAEAVKDVEGRVTYRTYVDDKTDIQETIKQLNAVIKNGDFEKWKTMIADESLKYWSAKSNLENISLVLRSQGLELHSLEDYFRYYVVKSRSDKTPGRIRYSTPDYIKVFESNTKKDIIFYEFAKEDGEWKVHLREF